MIAVGKHIELPKGVLPNDEPNDWCIVRNGENFYAYEDDFSQSEIDYVKAAGGLVFSNRDSYNEWLRGEKEVGDEVESQAQVFKASKIPIPELEVAVDSVMELESKVSYEVKQISDDVAYIESVRLKESDKTKQEFDVLWKATHDIYKAYQETIEREKRVQLDLAELRRALADERVAVGALQKKAVLLEIEIEKSKVSFWDKVKQKFKDFVG